MHLPRALLFSCALPFAAAVAGQDAVSFELFDQQTLLQLLEVRRVYVDRLSGGQTAVQIRDMLIASLQQARLFVITENEERADAVIRGSGEDLVFTDTFSSSEGINARVSVGTTSSVTGSGSNRRSANAGVGENQSVRTAERKHEAQVSVRLVSKSGDVLWSTTEESQGGKFRGASADVADRITRKLVEDYRRARRAGGGAGGQAATVR